MSDIDGLLDHLEKGRSGERGCEAAATIRALREALVIAEAPPCFACGAKITERCQRAMTKPCGREHKGGTRAALVAHGRVE